MVINIYMQQIIVQANITNRGGLSSQLDPERGGATSGIGTLDPLSFFFFGWPPHGARQIQVVKAHDRSRSGWQGVSFVRVS